ncbi:hypothetical protein QRX60_10865 [Amycolatopsis mongoliensis]|uniref:Uncharacterized protein n=1 Tax=Amycolatopsis mongoliensis TaxID=715475 RepID=A0A9Y2JVA0_9PSEU|nr:hypothetical protein [Amycolatopsis sp. 4-36]WIY04311.1 hypothetical protein QRX60_10865 [Amycolatopsis sp. 4-36]
MSWQDDLRRLDADLAAGRIEPAAHRKQRDELLAQASGSTVPSPVPSPLRRPATAWHSTNPAGQQPVDPRTAPPQRMESPSTGPHQPPRPAPPWQRTDSGAQRTLSHHGVPAVPDHLTTAPSPADITPTRYMRVEGPGPEPDPISRFPPLGRQVHHRPEEPEEAPGRHRYGSSTGSGRPAWLFISLGVLVVLLMVVGVTAWLGSGDDTPSQGAPAPGTSSSAAGVRPDPLEDRLPKLPGDPNPNNSTMAIEKARDLGLIPAPTADLFTSNGAKEMVFRGSADGDVHYLVLVIPTSSAVNAQTVVETLYQQGLASGMHSVSADVRTISGHIDDQFLNTSWYGSGNNAIVIGVGLPYKGQYAMSGELAEMVKQFESVLPAG